MEAIDAERGFAGIMVFPAVRNLLVYIAEAWYRCQERERGKEVRN